MSVSRNAPCPCGSGKKYKQCCAGNSRITSHNTRPGTPELMQQAIHYFNRGLPDQADILCQQVLSMQPRYVDALNLHGLIEFRRTHYENAIKALERATRISPENAYFQNNLGNVYQESGHLQEAIGRFRRAISLSPRNADFHFNHGNALYRNGSLEEAEQSFRLALELAPDSVKTINHLGLCLRMQARVEEAEQQFRQAMSLAPDDASAWFNLGNMLRDHSRFQEAIPLLEQAIRLDPGHVDAHFMLAVSLLSSSRLEEGWKEYFWRFRVKEADGRQLEMRPFAQPLWQGEPLSGKTLLVWGEQGLGDKLLFAGMLPDAIRSASRVIVECEPRLVSLFARSFPNAAVYPYSNPPHPELETNTADYQSPLGNLARWYRPSLAAFPTSPGGYLAPDREQVNHWKDWLNTLGSGLKVGICWRSMKRGGYRDLHYTELDQWGDILKTPGVTFVNLQYGECAEELADAQTKFGVRIHEAPGLDLKDDLDRCAALIDSLDLVISAGTTVFALAGALGKSVWLFTIPRVWDRLGTEGYPWFPDVRIFEKHEPDWSPCLSGIAAALATKTRMEKMA